MILKVHLYLSFIVSFLHTSINIDDDTIKINLLKNALLYFDTSSKKTFIQT